MDEIKLPTKLVIEIYRYLGKRPVEEVNVLFNSLAIEINKAQKAEEAKAETPEKGKE